MKNMGKRYIFVGIVAVLVGVLVWQLSGSYAKVDQGYSGKNIISGDKWGINITKVGEVKRNGNADMIGDISTIGTTLNFKAVLFKPGDEISFDIEVENTSVLDGELYAYSLSGVNNIDSEYVTYSVVPSDGSIFHTNTSNGSILKSASKQVFTITLSYDDIPNATEEYQLDLGLTLIYKQK